MAARSRSPPAGGVVDVGTAWSSGTEPSDGACPARRGDAARRDRSLTSASAAWLDADIVLRWVQRVGVDRAAAPGGTRCCWSSGGSACFIRWRRRASAAAGCSAAQPGRVADVVEIRPGRGSEAARAHRGAEPDQPASEARGGERPGLGGSDAAGATRLRRPGRLERSGGSAARVLGWRRGVMPGSPFLPNVRLIAPEPAPAMDGRDFVEGVTTLANWPQDVVALADSLGLGELAAAVLPAAVPTPWPAPGRIARSSHVSRSLRQRGALPERRPSKNIDRPSSAACGPQVRRCLAVLRASSTEHVAAGRWRRTAPSGCTSG